MKRIVTACLCASLGFLSSCTDVGFLDFLSSLPPDFFASPTSVPPVDVAGGADSGSGDTGRSTPSTAAAFTLRVINQGGQTVDVTIRMLLDDVEIRSTFLRLLRGASTVEVGPDLANTIIVSGVRADGTSTQNVTFRFGEQFDVDAIRDYVVSDPPPPLPPTQPIPEAEPEPEPEPDPELVVEPEPEPEPEPEIIEVPAPGGGNAFVDCNANGVSDIDDITLGASLDCNLNGIPDECEGDAPGECCFGIVFDEFVTTDAPNPGAGFIDVNGGTDCYTFAGAAGQEIRFDAINVGATPESFCTTLPVRMDWSCVGPNGEDVFASRQFLPFSDPTEVLPVTGIYTIVVQASPGTSGSHAFVLREVEEPLDPEDPVFDAFNINIGDTVGLDSPGVGAGRLENSGSEDTYTFTALGGETVYFDIQGGSSNFRWTCLDPNSTNLFSNVPMNASFDPGLFQLVAGEYTMTVNSPFSSFGTYQFEIVSEPVVETFDDIAFDTRVSLDNPAAGAGRLDTIGERDVYTFTLPIPDLEVYFDLDPHFDDTEWRLEDPSGGLVFDRRMSFGDPGRLTLGPTGVYTITVSNPGGAVGNYGFEIILPVAATVLPISFGTPVAGDLDSPFAVHVYYFTTSPGNVYFDAVGTDSFNTVWECRDLQGAVIFGPEVLDPSFDPGGFDLDGESFVFVSTTGEGGSYVIEIGFTPAPNAIPLNVDEVTNGNFDTLGQQDVYTFTAPSSGEVYIDAIATQTFDLEWKCVPVRGGPTVFTRDFSPFDDPGRFTLSPDEDYEITVTSFSGESDNYVFEVIAEAPAQVIPLLIGAPSIGDSLDDPLAVHQYTFSAAADTRVYFEALVASSPAVRWRCDGGDAGVVFDEQDFFSDPGEFVLGADNYTITVFTNSNTVGSYNFNLHGPLPDPFLVDINIGITVEVGGGDTGQFGETHVFTFEASAGTRVYFDAISAGEFGTTWKCVEDATQNTVFGERSLLSSDPGNRTLNAGGSYTITVFNGGDAPLDYAFETHLVNDACEDTLCAFDGFVAFDSAFATPDGPGDCSTAGDLWYEYVALCTAPITVDLCESDFDTVLGVYEGCDCASSILVECNDDLCGEQSSITFDGEAGRCYLIRVGGSGGLGMLAIEGCDR